MNAKLQTRQLFALSPAQPRGVDRPTKTIRGCCVAQVGTFREDMPRGQFDRRSLHAIVKAMQAARPHGVKCHLGHQSIVDDGIAKFVGRFHDARVEGDAVRADLRLDKSAEQMPGHGNVVDWLLTRCESDPTSLCSSLVVADVELDGNGSDVPVWLPRKVLACDLCDEGAAVSSLLSASIGTPNMDRLRQQLDDLDAAAHGEFPRIERYGERIDAMNQKMFDMLYPVEPEPELPEIVSTVDAVGYVAIWGLPAESDKPHERWAFRKGSFHRTLSAGDNVQLKSDHYRIIGQSRYGQLELCEDGIGLRCTLHLDPTNPYHLNAITRIANGELWFSPGWRTLHPDAGQMTHRCGDVVYLDRSELLEVSLTDYPRWRGTDVVLTRGPIPARTWQAQFQCRDEQDRLFANVTRHLLRWRSQLAY